MRAHTDIDGGLHGPRPVVTASAPIPLRRGPLRGRGRRGQAAVEFALGAMLFITLTLAIMQFAILYHMRLVVAHACREGARYAAARLTTSPYTSSAYTESQVKQFIIARAGTLHPPLTENDITLTPSDPAQRVANTNLKVTIRYDFRAVVPLIAPLLPSVITFVAEARARLE